MKQCCLLQLSVAHRGTIFGDAVCVCWTMPMNHYVSGSSSDWPNRTQPFVVFLGSITTAEFVPKLRFERERFLYSFPNVNIKILPHRSKHPNSIPSAALSSPKRTTYNAWHSLRISTRSVCGGLREKIVSPKYSLIPGYKYTVSHYTPLLLSLPFWRSVWTSAGV